MFCGSGGWKMTGNDALSGMVLLLTVAVMVGQCVDIFYVQSLIKIRGGPYVCVCMNMCEPVQFPSLFCTADVYNQTAHTSEL